MLSYSRQENFSRTCSTTFQRRGSHSSEEVTTSPPRSRKMPPLHGLLLHRRVHAQLPQPTHAAQEPRRRSAVFDRDSM